MEKELITVIVPVYNAQQYVERCILSLMGQTYQNLQILLVDDGSLDQSGILCDEYAGKDPRIRVIHTKNGGVSKARNLGMEQADGAYFAFVDADDYLDPDMLRTLHRNLKESGAAVSGCGYHIFSENQKGKPQAESGQGACTVELFRQEETQRFLEEGILSGDTRVWSKLFTREQAFDVRFDTELSIGEDMLFLLQIVLKGTAVCRTTYRGYYYNQNASGAMNQTFVPSYMDQIACWQKAGELIVKQYPLLAAQAAAVLVMAVLLTAGKLAVAEAGQDRSAYEQVCARVLKKCLRVRGAYGRLSAGYKLKAACYRICPGAYLYLYGAWKGKRQ